VRLPLSLRVLIHPPPQYATRDDYEAGGAPLEAHQLIPSAVEDWDEVPPHLATNRIRGSAVPGPGKAGVAPASTGSDRTRRLHTGGHGGRRGARPRGDGGHILLRVGGGLRGLEGGPTIAAARGRRALVPHPSRR
jgi:hypothetical protein